MFRTPANCKLPAILPAPCRAWKKALSAYPREPRSDSDSGDRAAGLQAQRRQARRRDLEELRRIESEVGAAADAASQQALGERVRAVAENYPNDGEVLFANGLLHRMGLLEVTQKILLDRLKAKVRPSPTTLRQSASRSLPSRQPAMFPRLRVQHRFRCHLRRGASRRFGGQASSRRAQSQSSNLES